MSCGVTFQTLVDYRFGALEAGEQSAFEDHLFACDACSARAHWLTSLHDALRHAITQGAVTFAASSQAIERAQELGLSVRSYSVLPGQTVSCTAAPEDDLIVTRLRVSVPGTRTVDLVSESTNLATGQRTESARSALPVDPNTSEAIFVLGAAQIRELPRSRWVLRASVDDGSQRYAAVYTLDHTPWAELSAT